AISLTPHALAPVAELPVLEVVFAVHLVCDLTLGLGKVAYDYLQPSTKRESAPKPATAVVSWHAAQGQSWHRERRRQRHRQGDRQSLRTRGSARRDRRFEPKGQRCGRGGTG